MTADFGPEDRIGEVSLAADAPRPASPEMAQELDVALYDLAEDNRFRAAEAGAGPYRVTLALAGPELVLAVEGGAGTAALALPRAPLAEAVADHAAITQRYLEAVRRLPPAEIEAIDADRRAIHDEGAEALAAALAPRAETDHATARRLFTAVAALLLRG